MAILYLLTDCRDEVFTLTEEEKRQQMSPLCHSPTSQLLKLAAQFLPSSVEPPSKIEMVEQSGKFL